jgi:3-oxoacyl-[acyl-carrier protein] reductase
MIDFTGRCAIITGASIGIGQATAEKLAELNCNLVLVARNIQKLEELQKKLEKKVDVLIFKCDVSDEQAVKTVVQRSIEHFSKIDILVNNAAIWRRWIPFAETDSSMWKEYINSNILGTLYFTHAVLQNMLENHYGRIINIGSVAGVYGNALQVDYSMTKGAIIAFTKALAKEVTDKGILVNCVSPGSVSNKQDIPEPTELSFTGRTGTHTENANLICFLASEEASYISGQNYQVDGCRKKM